MLIQERSRGQWGSGGGWLEEGVEGDVGGRHSTVGWREIKENDEETREKRKKCQIRKKTPPTPPLPLEGLHLWLWPVTPAKGLKRKGRGAGLQGGGAARETMSIMLLFDL